MEKIKKIGVLSFAKLQAIIGGLLGLLCGILYSFGGLLIDSLVTLGWITTNETPGLSEGTWMAFGALVGMPLIFAGFGYVLGIIEALIFNLFADKIGGLKVKIE